MRVGGELLCDAMLVGNAYGNGLASLDRYSPTPPGPPKPVNEQRMTGNAEMQDRTRSPSRIQRKRRCSSTENPAPFGVLTASPLPISHPVCTGTVMDMEHPDAGASGGFRLAELQRTLVT